MDALFRVVSDSKVFVITRHDFTNHYEWIRVLFPNMGCGSSKIDDLPLVTLCRERRDFVRAAADERYALAAAHVSYFRSLAAVGDALCKFVDEELVFGSNSGSSPVLTLPSDEGKRGKNGEGKGKGKHKVSSSSSTSISHSLTRDLHENGDNGGSHLNLSESESDFCSDSGHIHLHDDSSSKGEVGVGRDDDDGVGPSGYGYDYGNYGSSYSNQNAFDQYGRPSDQYRNPSYQGYGYFQGEGYGYSQSEGNGYLQGEGNGYMQGEGNRYPQGDWGGWNRGSEFMGPQTRTYFMKKMPTPAKSVVFEEPERYQVTENGGTGYGYSGTGNMNGGFFGYPTMGTRDTDVGIDRERSSQQQKPPPSPPLPPSVSTWDYFNVFETYDNGYMSYFQRGSAHGSTTSSPDSKEVREREGIPELEDETESEAMRVMYNERKKLGRPMNQGQKFGEGTSKAVPLTKSRGVSPMMSPPKDEESINSVPSLDSDSGETMTGKERKSSASDTVMLKSPMEEHPKKKEVSFEVEEIARDDVDSPKLGSLAPMSARGTRDVQEVVREIRHEFETASKHGKEVAMLLEVGKLPYQSRGTFLKVMFSRIIYLLAPSISSSYPSSRSTIRVSAQKMKAAALYFGDTPKDFNIRSLNISSTLEKLYVWEKKLYKEVKDEERLRIVYQEKCKKLKILDERGAEATKIDATQASIRKLLTRINVCVKTVNVISARIHRLRDEELRPQLNELISGLIRMWRSMLRCHQKQLQAIMESKVRVFKGNIDFQRESSLRATVELETELVNWCNCFSEWIKAQKSYVSSLNGWLLRCINHEPEDTADGPAPFSPSRMGAPAIFVLCNDWYQATERISGRKVSNTMRDFALRLHQLWERQDEEQRQRTRAEHMSKDFEKLLRFLRMEKGKMEVDQDALSERTAVSKHATENGVSRLDDLKNDLDSMRKKLEEERSRHKEAMNLVCDAASNSLQSGLVPIFESLGSFTSEVLRGYEEVRLRDA